MALKTYEKAELKIFEFDPEDDITTSSKGEGEEPSGGFGWEEEEGLE